MEEIEQLLIDIKYKLDRYYNATQGYYVGGVEYSALQKRIDSYLNSNKLESQGACGEGNG